MTEHKTEKAENGQPEPAVTFREVARAIGWLDAMTDDLEFTSADWTDVDDDGVVTLEGKKDGLDVFVTVEIKEVSWETAWRDDYWDDVDEGDEDDD